MSRLWLPALLGFPLAAGNLWTVRLEEPTGIYRRAAEVVRVPLAKVGGAREGYHVLDPAGKETPWQVAGKELLFPASVIPGELPRYRIECCTSGGAFRNPIVLREVGMRRVELGNERFRVILDRGVPAIVEAYSLTAGPQRMLNLVETTPDVPWNNDGWGTLRGGALEKVELLESGPLRGRVRLSGPGQVWEFTWTAGSAALRWQVEGANGFRFASISASPYLPFDRCVDGSEYDWPQGPEGGEPPGHAIGERPWTRLPGGHAVYYRQAENYGALGIVALDPELEWTGAGTRHVEARGNGGQSEIALTFPLWKGNDTVLEARRENRVLRQPLLVSVSGPRPSNVEARPAGSAAEVRARGPYQPDQISLDGEWELASGEKGRGPQSEWRKVRVPGTVHTQILKDPQYYTHEADWISSREWWYRKSFRVPERFLTRRARLQFDATDYYADTYLNGEYLGRHEGYIDPYEYDVKLKLENTMLVRVWTPVSYYWRHRPYTIKGSYGAVDQKPDDITAEGITRSVRLVASEGAVIRDAAVATRLAGGGADVEVQLTSAGTPSSSYWEASLTPRNFQSPERYTLCGSGSPVTLVFHLEKPHLWWTWDHGKPDLYTLEIRLLDRTGKIIDGRTLAVGVREIEKIGWTFYLNRRRMFVRGTNYYYNLFLSEMDRAKYERDLRLMLGMNVNMIRLHCHFTNPEFYDLADENGVLIWQDFLEAWYPHDLDFARRAAALYDNHIRYARNHPSVVLWTTSDEEDLENYRDITKHLAPRLFLLDPQRRPVVRSTGRYGDGHIYYGWYEGNIWQYTKMDEQFVSELGATALPNYESLVKFLPNAWPIKGHEEEWIFHKLQIPEAMRAWGDPGGMSLREYIPRTQSYTARLFQIALERMRRRKYDAGGVLHFHAIDIWPSVTMAAIDFYRVPTKTFYTVARSFAPVLASLEYDRDLWRPGEEFRCGVWAINDYWYEIPGAQVRWKIVGKDGNTREEGRYDAPMAADSVRKLGDVSWRAQEAGEYELRAEVRDAQGRRISENVFEFEVK